MYSRRISAVVMSIFMAAFSWGLEAEVEGAVQEKGKRVTHAQRQEAANRAAALGFSIQQQKTAAPATKKSTASPAQSLGMTALGATEAPHYFSMPNYANSPLPGYGTGIGKFKDGLPGLGSGKANKLDQYIPVAVADRDTYPGSDYYEIAVVEYQERMHTDLPKTTLRGYVQLNGGDPTPHYLGPAIKATKNRPVRILFRNQIPTGHYDPVTGLRGGDLFIPVDTTVMGSGMGPDMAGMAEMDPLNPMCSQVPKPDGCYEENRANLHLHGGVNPWISDGTPHQWITPAGEITNDRKGVSVANVPDMWFDASGNMIASCAGQTTCNVAGATNDPGPGAQTYYYTNQQSGRLMFYHDHSWGITRLNVYAGEAAPYVLNDPTEQALIGSGIIPGEADTIPLVIQDKTFVPSTAQLAVSDPLWDESRWGGYGSLWLPHVYSPAQNPGDASGVNQFGRWAYGPWFWPPTADVKYGPTTNPYYDSACNPDIQWCEPSMMPGVPYLSMGMESFHDTPVVNGTAYPTYTVEPKAYRMRILNAANDRFFNLQFYKAVDANGVVCDPAVNPTPAAQATGIACTEVLLNPAEVQAALVDPAGGFPTPDMTTAGPSWIQIGTEGGFLPTPVVIPSQPITWVTDPTVFNAGNVDKHSLLLGPAERADVIVDFSQFAGQTLILYNDAPAAFPARDPRYDYYTGNADLTSTGGAPSTLPGYGPNTRTVMQIKVSNDIPPTPYQTAPLFTAFAHHLDGSGNPAGVFESSQPPIIVGQEAYNAAYGKAFQKNGVYDGLVRIYETVSKTFSTLLGSNLTLPLQPKMIQDEMGEAFEHDYGRMSGNLGVETPNAKAGLQNMILYGFTFPPSEVIDGSKLPSADPNVSVTPISTSDDGTQLWKITHNGVDTHPIHFHLYDVQLINRVGWDGIIRKPDLNEVGWKDTVRVSPLEDTIVALRPLIPKVPFELPNSIRLLDPSMPEGVMLQNTTAQLAAGLPAFAFNPLGEPVDIVNHYVNFGLEYVWHCHILSHEEMDMMRPQVIGVAPKDPSGLTAQSTGIGSQRTVTLRWSDNSRNETAFTVQRATAAGGPWTTIATVPSTTIIGPTTGTRTYSDPVGNTNQVFFYRVQAVNVVGDAWDYTDPNINGTVATSGFPNKSLVSAFSNTASTIAAGGSPELTGFWSRMTYANGMVSGTVQVSNAGGSTAVQSMVTFYLSADGTTPGTVLRKYSAPVLQAGRSINIGFLYTSRAVLSGKYILAVIDSTNSVAESNEANNSVSRQIP